MQRDVEERQGLARYLLYRRAELNTMNEPASRRRTGQRIGSWAVGPVHSMLFDDKGHWRSAAGVPQVEALS